MTFIFRHCNLTPLRANRSSSVYEYNWQLKGLRLNFFGMLLYSLQIIWLLIFLIWFFKFFLKWLTISSFSSLFRWRFSDDWTNRFDQCFVKMHFQINFMLSAKTLTKTVMFAIMLSKITLRLDVFRHILIQSRDE